MATRVYRSTTIDEDVDRYIRQSKDIAACEIMRRMRMNINYLKNEIKEHKKGNR